MSPVQFDPSTFGAERSSGTEPSWETVGTVGSWSARAPARDEEGAMNGDGPVTMAYYRTRWGAHDEFVGLFDRNHWPILRE